MSIPSVILFDLDNTLVDHMKAVRGGLVLLQQAFPDELGALPFADLLRAFHEINDALWADYARGAMTSVELRIRRMESLLRWAGRWAGRCGAAEALSEYYVRSYIRSTAPFDGVEALLKGLTGRGHTVGVITNGFIVAQDGKLERAGLRQYFTHVVFSEHVGVMKPDRRIFDHAVGLAGCAACDAVYIGDSFAHDVAGAHGAGLRSIWFNPFGNAVPEGFDGTCPEFIAASIEHLTAYLLGGESGEAVEPLHPGEHT